MSGESHNWWLKTYPSTNAGYRSVREQIPLDIQKRTDVYGVVGPDALHAESAAGEPGWIELIINRFIGRAKSDNKASNSGGVSEKK